MRTLLKENPILCILRNIPTRQVCEYARAVQRGGIELFEVTMNSDEACDQISLLKQTLGKSAVVGAGTAISCLRAEQAVAAGADFLLSPSADEGVLSYCSKNHIPMLPGVMTPSDVSLCLRYGFDTLKLFPAGAMPSTYIKNLKGPFDMTDYVAIGGVSTNNIISFFEQGYIGVGMGSNIVPQEYITSGDWERISQHISKLVCSVKLWKGVTG